MFPQSFKQKDKNQLMAAAKTGIYHQKWERQKHIEIFNLVPLLV
jgi:hypothetical protein